MRVRLPPRSLTVAAAWAGARARTWFALAERAHIGAIWEARARAALEPLRRKGVELYFNVGWPGKGDIDIVAIAPGRAPRVIVAIEVKARRYTNWHLRRTLLAARMLARGGPHAAVLVTGARREPTIRMGVYVCSVDQIAQVVLSLVRHPTATTQRPRRRAQRTSGTAHRRAAHVRGEAGSRTAPRLKG